MVIFITSKSAYNEMKSILFSTSCIVWLAGEEFLSEKELEELWEKENIDLSVFNDGINTSDPRHLECAMSTIREHHPGENIWVQFQN